MAHRLHIYSALAVALLWLFALSPAHAGIARVWAVGDGEKVKADDLANPHIESNSVWDGKSIRLFAARNEVVAFQVIVESDQDGAQDVDVTLPDLQHVSGAKLVSLDYRSDITDYRGGQIERFLQHYLDIRRPSPPGWFYTRESRPKAMAGPTPDALVPPAAPKGLGGMPFDIAAIRNQGVWFDIYVPKGGFPAGTYRGEVTVTVTGDAVATIPIELTVWDFTLPDEPHFTPMIYFEEETAALRHGYKSAADGAGMIAGYHRLAHRHRVELTKAYTPDASKYDLELLSGRAFSLRRHYVGPGEEVGYRIVPATFYGLGKQWLGMDAWKTADAFVSWLQSVKPEALSFLYIIDEPDRDRLPWVKMIAENVRANPGPGSGLPTFVTTAPPEGDEAAVDIWATVADQVDLSRYDEVLATGAKWIYYNGMRPYSGTQVTDAPAVDCRVPAWACFRYGMDVWFYWHANHWRHNSQSPRAGKDQDVWTDPVTFGGAGGVNGDGVLVYPGHDEVFPEQDRKPNGPIASIRLKNIRRGVQDYEYLWLARAAGLEDQVREIVIEAVPAVFSEASGDVAWSERGSDWDRLRIRVGRLLHGLARAPDVTAEPDEAVEPTEAEPEPAEEAPIGPGEPPSPDDEAQVAPVEPGPPGPGIRSEDRRERRRESIVFAPATGREKRLNATMNGRVAGQRISATSDFVTVVDKVGSDGRVHVRTRLGTGTAQVGSKKYSTDTGAEWMALFDSRHLLERVDLITPPREGELDSEDVLDLASIMMYVFFAVAYHVRSAGVDTEWVADYSTIDVQGRKLYLSEKHRLTEFLWEGGRRVAVIQSQCVIPIRANISGAQIAGRVNSTIVSEVYVDTGEIRYRHGMGDGPLSARAGGFSINVSVSKLETTLRAVGPNGKPVEPLKAHTLDAWSS